MRKGNPFRPTAGATPPLLVGRDHQLEYYRESIVDGPGAPALLSMVTGARGVGKTVMLTALGDVAKSEGWLVIDETATPGFLDRLALAAEEHAAELGAGERSRIKGFTLPVVQGGVEWDGPNRPQPSWRGIMSRLLDVLAKHETGLVITLDEIHSVASDEITQLAADIQLLIREERPISLVCAGLPSAISDLLNGDVTTFLRRAERIELGAVSVDAVVESLLMTFDDTGRSISSADLQLAAEATGGYPFMIQLVGYHLWRLADDEGAISSEAVMAGIDAAQVRLGSLVHATALADLSDVDRTFLLAMAQDDGPSRTAEIAARMGREVGYVSVYRERLIRAGIIKPAGRGAVDFLMPHLRPYLRGHGASLVSGA